MATGSRKRNAARTTCSSANSPIGSEAELAGLEIGASLTGPCRFIVIWLGSATGTCHEQTRQHKDGEQEPNEGNIEKQEASIDVTRETGDSNYYHGTKRPAEENAASQRHANRCFSEEGHAVRNPPRHARSENPTEDRNPVQGLIYDTRLIGDEESIHESQDQHNGDYP